MSKNIGRIAKRYARALFGLYEVSQLEAIDRAVSDLSKLWEENTELRAALKNPAFSLSDRAAVLRSVVAVIRPSDQTFSNFCEVLVQRNRLDGLPAIARSFSEMVLEVKNMLAVQVTSAFAPQAGEIESLKDNLQKEFGSMASVTWQEDQSVIGGLRIKVGDKLLDGSVRGALDRLAAQLLPA